MNAKNEQASDNEQTPLDDYAEFNAPQEDQAPPIVPAETTSKGSAQIADDEDDNEQPALRDIDIDDIEWDFTPGEPMLGEMPLGLPLSDDPDDITPVAAANSGGSGATVGGGSGGASGGASGGSSSGGAADADDDADAPLPHCGPTDIRENWAFIDLGDRGHRYVYDSFDDGVSVIGGGRRPDDVTEIIGSKLDPEEIADLVALGFVEGSSVEIASLSEDEVAFCITNDNGVVDAFHFTGDAAETALSGARTMADFKDRKSSFAVFDFGEKSGRLNDDGDVVRGGDRFFHGSDGSLDAASRAVISGSSLGESEVDEFVFALLDDHTGTGTALEDIDVIGLTETSLTFQVDNGRGVDTVLLLGEVVAEAIGDYAAENDVTVDSLLFV